jgi:uridylate kinase
MNNTLPAPIIISLGGSLIVPNHIDTEFLKAFKALITARVENGERFVLIVGGGKTARIYQDAAQAVTAVSNEDKDWIGIHATRINAQLMRTSFAEHAHPEIVTDPEHVPFYTEPILIGSGSKPGWSTDFVAVKLAQKLGATSVINLSNIDQVYTADPRKDANAKPIEKITWKDYLGIIPTEWSPGLSSPFDPVASREADASNISVAIINGAHLDRLENCLAGKEFLGSTISN